MNWTDERVETLKRLWGDGLSASQIAAELGGITRNAVIGKVHRLGLSGRAKSATSAAPRQRKPRSTQILRVSRPAARGNTALAQAFEFEVEAEPELVENVVPIGQRRTLLELNEATCRWPIGDPGSQDFFFCGGPAEHSRTLLRVSFAHRLPADQHAPRPAAAIQRIATGRACRREPSHAPDHSRTLPIMPAWRTQRAGCPPDRTASGSETSIQLNLYRRRLAMTPARRRGREWPF